jgi:hypothetical protein
MPSFDIDWFNITGEYKYYLPIQRPTIKEETAQYEWRHLGNFQSNEGSSKELSSQLDTIVSENLKYVCSKNLTPDGALQGYALKILNQILNL